MKKFTELSLADLCTMKEGALVEYDGDIFKVQKTVHPTSRDPVEWLYFTSTTRRYDDVTFVNRKIPKYAYLHIRYGEDSYAAAAPQEWFSLIKSNSKFTVL